MPQKKASPKTTHQPTNHPRLVHNVPTSFDVFLVSRLIRGNLYSGEATHFSDAHRELFLVLIHPYASIVLQNLLK